MARFLVVDDDPDNRAVVSEALRYMGFAVDEAASAEGALILLEKAPPEHYDVLLTDVDMPGMSGLELVRRVRAKPDHPYTVVMSGTAEYQEVLATGAEDFLSKPFGLEALRERF